MYDTDWRLLDATFDWSFYPMIIQLWSRTHGCAWAAPHSNTHFHIMVVLLSPQISATFLSMHFDQRYIINGLSDLWDYGYWLLNVWSFLLWLACKLCEYKWNNVKRSWSSFFDSVCSDLVQNWSVILFRWLKTVLVENGIWIWTGL